MLENDDVSVSMVSLPNLSFPEMNVIPLPCWQNISLSKIWIPSHLLPNRKNLSNTWETRGIFHTLEKRGQAKQIESFSVYSDSDNESEADIFQSDSDDAFDLDSISHESMKIKDDLQKSTEKAENFSGLKSFSVKSNISLNEILNSNTETDITNFEFKKNHKYASKEEEKSQSNKKYSSKKKSKVVKSVTLDEFLEDYTEDDKQNDYANDYMQKVLAAKHKEGKEDEVQLKNIFEFPDLNFSSKEIEFIHNEKSNTKKPEISFKTVTQILCQPDDDANIINNAEITSSELETTVGKIVIENIPSEVCHEDIYTLLSGYGEIKDFTLVPDGDFLKAVVKIDLMCDIDWIIDCLNGTEPFGASSRVLKCYKM